MRWRHSGWWLPLRNEMKPCHVDNGHRAMRSIAFFFLVAISLGAAEKYTGPKPDKVDIPYLVHADTLIETEAVEAREETRKDATVATIPGASAKAKTPLAEPIFIIRTEK